MYVIDGKPRLVAVVRLAFVINQDRKDFPCERWEHTLDWSACTGWTPFGRMVRPKGAKDRWRFRPRRLVDEASIFRRLQEESARIKVSLFGRKPK